MTREFQYLILWVISYLIFAPFQALSLGRALAGEELPNSPQHRGQIPPNLIIPTPTRPPPNPTI